MKLGTWVRLQDGREGTVVFNGLVGVGIKWGRHDPKPEDFEGSVGDLGAIGVHAETSPELEEWTPDALLRDPWPGCDEIGIAPEQCVGREFEVIPRNGEI